MEISKQYVNYKNNGWGYHPMTSKYVTIHNTANNASAQNERDYVAGRTGEYPTYHFAVDEKEFIQLVPENVNAWHCGDGNGSGNRESIGIEICKSTGDTETYKKCEDKSAELTAHLLMKYGFSTSQIKFHNDWSGKYCPHKMMDLNEKSNLEAKEYFIAKVNKYLGKKTEEKPEPPKNNSSEYVYSDYPENGSIYFKHTTKVYSTLEKAIAHGSDNVATYYAGETLNNYQHVYLTKYTDSGKKAFSYVRYNRSSGGHGYLAFRDFQRGTTVGTVK